LCLCGYQRSTVTDLVVALVLAGLLAVVLALALTGTRRR
jgi:hypothetical protein